MCFLKIFSVILLYNEKISSQFSSLVSSDTREYHNQLRNFVQNRTLMDDLTDDDKASDIPVFNPDNHEELREGNPDLMGSGEDLIDIQSEDED